jgi:phage repressor protein C with HTH and peptisase S24 domain
MSETQEPFHQRLNLLIERLENGVQRRFAQKVGVLSGVIGDMLGKKKSKPGFDIVGKIVHAYPEINERWLLLGEGDMLKSEVPKTEVKESLLYMSPQPGGLAPTEPAQRVQPTDNLRILTVQVGSDGDENIELVPVWAAAGYAAGGFTEPTFIQKLPSFRLPGAAFNNGSFRAFQVHGASMQGTLEDGDWIICRFVEKWAHDILDNRVYVIVTETDVLVKRVLNQFNERGQLSLHSDNPSFDVQPLDGREVREVWQGVARLTQDLTNTRLDVPVELARQQAALSDMLTRITKLEEVTEKLA